MNVTDFYQVINADYRDVLDRMLGREELVLKFLKKYCSDSSFIKLETAMAGGNVEEIFKAAHTLKGVVSNLGLRPITESTDVLVELTRAGKSDGINEAFEKIKAAYHETIALIEKVE